MELVRNLKDVTKKDVKIAGGKGAALGELIRAGAPVPPGFVILASTYEKFLKEGKMSDEIAGAILKAFNKLGAKKVAVRSSATAEDSKSASWAGQLETYLNTDEKNLLKNVQKCWESISSERANFYRAENKLQKKKIAVAVVVQKMVDAEVAGVAFTANPVTEDRDQIVIEAVAGLGEKLVSGQVTPDTYVINKKTLALVEVKNGKGTQELSEKQIGELAKLCIKIEKHFKTPQDIEWAFEKGKFYIVQSRPITTSLDRKQKKLGLLEYLKSQRWFFGVRNEESLLFYSVKGNGYAKHLEKIYGIAFAESLLIPIKKKRPIRVFNLEQAKEFHAVSNKRILKNPQILLSYIKKEDTTYQKIATLGRKLQQTIGRNDFKKSTKLFIQIADLYEIASAYFIIIFSLGLKLAENKRTLKNIKEVGRAHDVWRNSVAFKEEALGEQLFYFFKFLTERKKLSCKPLSLMKFLTLQEVETWLDGKISDKNIVGILEKRQANGYVYLSLRNEKREVIDDPKEMKETRDYFVTLDAESRKSGNAKILSGQIAYDSHHKITGEVVVIKDKALLKNKSHLIDDKILVAIQTTPHFIPYLKKAKAIITDEGGVTCHAAIVAREMKIPCIVGTKVATQALKDGDRVEMDTEKGIVRIIK